MVALQDGPPDAVRSRRVGLFNRFWFAGFLLICTLVAVQPVTLRDPEHPDAPEEYSLYRRDIGTSSSVHPTVEILVVGDVMLGRRVAEIDNPFSELAQLLLSADLTVGNFEGVISDQGSITNTLKGHSISTPFQLVSPIRVAGILQLAGFDLLSLANNHSLDLGRFGLKDTIENLARVDIKTMGIGNNLENAFQPTIINLKGIKIAFLAIDAIAEPLSDRTTGQALQRATWNRDRVLTAIQQLSPVSDVILVMIHWGNEYEIRAGPAQRRAAQEMVEAGADVVIGSHPHVVQETQVFERSSLRKVGFVAYSLGNFVFDQFEENTRVGLALKLVVDIDGLKKVAAIPIHAGPIPELLAPAESQKLIERIRPEPAWSGFQCNLTTCFTVHTMSKRGSGLFQSGQIDLNADGMLETVRLEYGRVLIFEGGRLGWESPQDWRVLDVALGDPNDDGRGEVMLVLQKPDKSGKLASHPFIIGHRGGIYRQVWGGSAVAIPLREVELADVDGDGKQELLVLEELKDGMNAIVVMKWDDWVFRLFWRSAPGRFEDLHVIETADGQKVISIGEIR
jgi:Bacterial capsule synthesis protein PGA_cap